MRALILILIAGLAMVGCSNKKSLLVGTWKAEAVKQPASSDIKDMITSGLYSFATQGMTIEFNDKDRFKMSVFVGSGTGTYDVNGDEVELKIESEKSQEPLKFKFKDDRTLESVTEFASDPKIILRKQ